VIVREIEIGLFYATIVLLSLAAILYIWSFITGKTGKAAPEVSGAGPSHRTAPNGYSAPGFLPASIAALAGFLSLTVMITARAITTGHGPFSSMYEFAIAFAWGTLVMGLYFARRYRTPLVGGIGVAVALALLFFAATLPSQAAPLVPALQQSLLLSIHVASAIIAYGSLTTGFGAAVLYMIRDSRETARLPALEILDDLSYRTVLVGFPALTLVIVLGAIWAEIAWGRYWSWDPKETASLVTWLVYAGYMHARVLRGWQGRKSALLLIAGFLAILFTFFGNYFFRGLHSYG
jgi:cytochrome c-type biogenesis protein CcsB